MKRTTPILAAFPILDLGETEINSIMKAARTFPVLQAFEDEEGKYILIATTRPTERQTKNHIKTL